MRSARKILIAFLLNITFSAFELIGGLLTNSVAILSDAIHDFGDALSIGIAFFLEKKAMKRPDHEHTYGYARYSILGAFITTVILIAGSVLIIVQATQRIIAPQPVNYDGMLMLAIVGVVINSLAAIYTMGGRSLNQKAVNLHMLDDVLGWVVVLVGSILMRFTNITLIDPLMSIGVALFILWSACKNFKEILDLFLLKTPENISISELKRHLKAIPGVESLHHLHLWSLDGTNNFATMHVVTTRKDVEALKAEIKAEMSEHGIGHTTIELEAPKAECKEHECEVKPVPSGHHHH